VTAVKQRVTIELDVLLGGSVFESWDALEEALAERLRRRGFEVEGGCMDPGADELEFDCEATTELPAFTLKIDRSEMVAQLAYALRRSPLFPGQFGNGAYTKVDDDGITLSPVLPQSVR
jgi:hypothetical protein